MKKYLKYLPLLLLVLPFVFFPEICRADALLDKIGESGGMAKTDLTTLIANLIKVILSILGVILVVLIIYAGFKWMTAGGESKGATEAKTILQNAIIGLVIIVAAWAITTFVVDSLKKSVGDQTGPISQVCELVKIL
ncbi:MAG TPA: pilin [bacterium]|nr:pilin [bacterium]